MLYEWAAASKPGFYTELSSQVTAIEWLEGEAFGAQMGWMLGQLSLEELSREEDRPLLSALVIGKDEGMPSHGYWEFLKDLGEPVPIGDGNRTEAWYREFARACSYFAARRAADL